MSRASGLAIKFAREVSAAEERNRPVHLSSLELSLVYWAVRRDLKDEIAVGRLDAVDIYIDVLELLAIARERAA